MIADASCQICASVLVLPVRIISEGCITHMGLWNALLFMLLMGIILCDNILADLIFLLLISYYLSFNIELEWVGELLLIQVQTVSQKS